MRRWAALSFLSPLEELHFEQAATMLEKALVPP
jgi:hypothetical protein